MKQILLFSALIGVLLASCNNNSNSATKLALTFSTADTATIITFNGKQAYEHITGTYTPTKKYNVWIAMPGAGETVGAITLLKNAGPFQWIVDSTVLDTSLIIIAPQPNEAFVSTAEMQGYINAAKTMFNVNKIAVSGYSLGAQDWSNFLWASASNFSQVSAWFMASADPTVLPQYGGPTVYPKWFATDSVYYDGICGTADGFYAPQLALYDSIVSYKPYYTPSFTTLAGVGHTSASWGPYFSPYYHDPVTGLSKYQTFMRLFPVTNAVTPPVPVPLPTPIGKYLVRTTTVTNLVTKTITITNVYSDSTSTQMVIQ